jgi:hypothetical protein
MKKKGMSKKKKNTQKRKRGTTILVKNNLINQLNINELKIGKDGEIEGIELTTDNYRNTCRVK